MLNNFGFHLYAQNSLFIGEKGVRLYAELSTDIHNFQIFFELHVDVSEKSFQDHS